MEDLATALSQQRQLFASMHAYPTSTFPGVAQEMLLQQLLRKKLDPKAEDWLEENAKPVQEEAANTGSAGHLKDADMRELWSWAKGSQASVLERLMEEGAWDDDFTIKEREDGVENVVTGLKQRLDTDDEDGDDEDEDKMEDVESQGGKAAVNSASSQPAVPLDSLLRIASGQDVPGLAI